MPHQILGIGLAGTSLSDLERRILREMTPYAVVLFGRNVGDPEQLRELIREVKSIARIPPVFMIDEEGGRVDRLRTILPGLPSAQAFDEGAQPAEMSAWAGRIIGMALRYFDIEVDLAPVVDIRGPEAPKGLERRTFADDAERVCELAGAFLRGLHGAGTASCLKHFPGIGLGSDDSHYAATIIDQPGDALAARDLVPFARLGNDAGAILIGHGTYPGIDPSREPATLSHRISTELLRHDARFDGVAITDDMEMHAVSDLGPWEEIAERALMAGNDALMFCSDIERIPALHRYLSDRMAADPRVARRAEEARQRRERFGAHIQRLRAQAPPPLESFDELVDELARFVDAFTATRPRYEIIAPEVDRRTRERDPRKGKRTGREEWT